MLVLVYYNHMGTQRAVGIGRLEAALAQLVRRANTPRVQERLAHRAGVTLDRALYVTIARIGDGETIRLTDLANELGVDVSTSSRQVRALEDQGLIHRESDDRDRRVAMLALTDDGRSLLHGVRAARVDALAQVVDGWPDTDIDRLGELVERLVADLGRGLPGVDGEG